MNQFKQEDVNILKYINLQGNLSKKEIKSLTKKSCVQKNLRHCLHYKRLINNVNNLSETINNMIKIADHIDMISADYPLIVETRNNLNKKIDKIIEDLKVLKNHDVLLHNTNFIDIVDILH